VRATGAREQATAKFIQICASQNDLFALDEHGNIYRYNFSTKAWATLDADVDGFRPDETDGRERAERS
jgi:hypothetical protein